MYLKKKLIKNNKINKTFCKMYCFTLKCSTSKSKENIEEEIFSKTFVLFMA